LAVWFRLVLESLLVLVCMIALVLAFLVPSSSLAVATQLVAVSLLVDKALVSVFDLVLVLVFGPALVLEFYSALGAVLVAHDKVMVAVFYLALA